MLKVNPLKLINVVFMWPSTKNLFHQERCSVSVADGLMYSENWGKLLDLVGYLQMAVDRRKNKNW